MEVFFCHCFLNGKTSCLCIFSGSYRVQRGFCQWFRSQFTSSPVAFPGTPTPSVQGFDKYGIGAFSAIPTPHLQQALGLKAGVVTSGNSLDFTAEDMALMVQNQAAVKVGGRDLIQLHFQINAHLVGLLCSSLESVLIC